MSGHALVVRLDSMGDMLICGPAIRAVAAAENRVTVLAGPEGAAAARLLPGVHDVLGFDCPWIRPDSAPVDPVAFDGFVAALRDLRVDRALVLTSFHQSALPTALMLRLAGVPWVAAVSEDYPGSLLDIRITPPGDAPEPERMLAIAAAAGYRLPAGDDGRLSVRYHEVDLPVDMVRLNGSPYVAVHPGAASPARTYPDRHFAAAISLLLAAGLAVVVTGSVAEKPLVAGILRQASASAALPIVDLAGKLSLSALTAVLAAADAVVVGNTGPAHLAAAVGAPVVSLFSPVVPAVRWAPYGVPKVMLGDQSARCRGTRARECPIPGHPCLTSVSPQQVVAAVQTLRGQRARSSIALSGSGVRG